jgi:hypothetical protein
MADETLITGTQVRSLERFSFVTDFGKLRPYYARVTESIVAAARRTGVATPDAAEVRDLLTVALLEDDIFDAIVIRKLYIKPALKPVYAKLFAGYVVSQVWGEIKP